MATKKGTKRFEVGVAMLQREGKGERKRSEESVT